MAARRGCDEARDRPVGDGLPAGSNRVQVVEVGRLDGRGVLAGAEIVGLRHRRFARAGRQDLHGRPLSAAALMAAVRLTARQRLAHALVGISQPRRVDACGPAGDALHDGMSDRLQS